jgi:hypothetical protein
MNTFDGNVFGALEDGSLLQDMARGGPTAVFSEPDLMPASSYPSLGAADHESFCQNKLIQAGLDKEFFVEVATDRTIQIDFDIPFDGPLPQQFSETLEIFSRMLSPLDGKTSTATEEDRKLPENRPRTASWRKLKSRSGRTHVVISISWDMPQAERIAWQAAMGSDFRREALSLAYAALGQMSPVLLYSRKEEASLVIPIWPAHARV